MINFWVIEYSKKQQAYHISTASECTFNNIRLLSLGQNSEYIPLGFFKTRELAELELGKIKLLIENANIKDTDK